MQSDVLVSEFAFKCNLYRYIMEAAGQGQKPPSVTDWRKYVADEFYKPDDEVAPRAKL
jgi:hypothetical protein